MAVGTRQKNNIHEVDTSSASSFASSDDDAVNSESNNTSGSTTGDDYKSEPSTNSRSTLRLEGIPQNPNGGDPSRARIETVCQNSNECVEAILIASDDIVDVHSYYRVFGLERNAPIDIINIKYKCSLALQLYPDKNKHKRAAQAFDLSQGGYR
jgi:hypothetical protein